MEIKERKKGLAVKTKQLYQGLGWPSIFTQIRFFTAPYKKLERLVPEKVFVVDLGCGYGILANFLALSGLKREVLGIELDSKKIKFADKGLKNVKFLKADITKTTLKKADIIFLVHVLHHLDSFQDQEKLLVACRKKLNKNGKLIIVEVDRRPVFKFILGWLADRLLYPGDRIYYRFPKEFKQLFTKLKFKVKIIRADHGKPFAHMIYVAALND